MFVSFIEKISAHISGEDEASLKNSPRPPPEKSERSSCSSPFNVFNNA